MHSAPSPFPLYLLPSIPFRRRSSSATTIDTTSASSSPPTDHQSCSTDASSNLGSSAPSSPPSSPPRFLSGHRAHLRCTRCLTDLCLTSQIISKGFTGRHGRAYLVAPPNPYPYAGSGASTSNSDSSLRGDNNLPNTHTHKPVPRQLVTGAHTVSDISCALCGAVLGWKYVAAEEESQKYKVGKFILETKRVCRGVCWENETADEDNSVIGGRRGRNGAPRKEARSSVDSECSGAAGSGDGDGDDDAMEFDSQDEDECEDLFAGIWSPALARKRRRGRLWRDTRNGANGIEEV
ncbi:yippee family protein [Phyllosticta citrichinensis]|uniref:Yippee family protein n=1 Tax=Phyllosticta citrichinensis TaxID=1130410 RepID=A0ABR1XHL2_9PEZI